MQRSEKKILNVDEFDYSILKKFKPIPRPRGNPHGTKPYKYYPLVCGFDIETTRLKEIEQAVMYIWQFQLDLEVTVTGRTWVQFFEFLKTLRQNMRKNTCIVIYVHNLSYEFQFLKGMYEFQTEEVFATGPRQVLKCTMWDCFEFRDNYLHTNMSLAEYTHKMGVPDAKLKDFDYNKRRFSWTELSDDEMAYCVNDVLGMVEALKIEMALDHDTLYTIPLTSTGYVRRDCKRAMEGFNHKQLLAMLPDVDCYMALREAFRGGNTHASRWYARDILTDVKSTDRSSSYPDVMVNCLFPMKEFFHAGEVTAEELKELIWTRHKAVLMRVAFFNIREHDKYIGCPYLSRDKCRNIQNGKFDNGRILSADYLETTMTDIDFRIMIQMYDWDSLNAFDVWHTRYAKLPQMLIDVVNHYYKLKTELKGDPDNELYYMKAKNKLNSLYGMSAQDPVKDSIDFIDGDFIPQNKSVDELLRKSRRRAFLNYAWGVWVTAWARYRLHEGIMAAGHNFVYCDTDSVKYIGDIDLTAFNQARIEDSKKNGAYAVDSKGVTHYMGVFEPEGQYEKFSTMGAKKYCYVEDGQLHITIAGVNKSKGAEELEQIENFKEGFVFRKAGGTESLYNDHVDFDYDVEGHTVRITDNVVIRDSEYTLGLTEEYLRILEGCAEIKYSDHDMPGLYTTKRLYDDACTSSEE